MKQLPLNLFRTGIITASLLVSCSTPENRSTGESGRPNIVLFVTDDQGMEAGCYGNPVVHTPGIDRLASEGTRFDYAFCSTSSCSASRSTILTGLHNHANGQYGHAHDWFHFRTYDTIKTLPVVLSEAGCQTIRAGKYHVAPEEVYAFDHEIPKTSPEGMADRFGAFLESSGQEPFFFYFCTHEPHGPFNRKGSREISPEDVIVPAHVPDIPEMREKLYDLENDPDEAVNLAYDPEHREVFENLKQKIFDFQAETGDPWAIAQDFHLLRDLVNK